MIRLYQGAMHNREGPDVESRDLTRWEAAPIAALVAVIVALGVYPNFIVRRTEGATTATANRAALVACVGLSPRALAAGRLPIASPDCGGKQ
jgi:NADH:ubiquinone oxidoreductase subunit 4 (subunit M)